MLALNTMKRVVVKLKKMRLCPRRVQKRGTRGENIEIMEEKKEESLERITIRFVFFLDFHET